VQVEKVDFISVPTQDKERAREFYGEVLGLELEKPTPIGYEFAAGNVTIGIWEPVAVGMEFQPNRAPLALRVPDVAAARAELEGKGVQFDGETRDTTVCHMAFFADPDGNGLMLHRRYAPLGAENHAS
jgi:catechol 2,3-dioxygenase-like lactoylglutathione lyase family enzyme